MKIKKRALERRVCLRRRAEVDQREKVIKARRSKVQVAAANRADLSPEGSGLFLIQISSPAAASLP